MLTTRIAVLVSGGGTNLQALIDAQASGELKSGILTLVIADKPGIGAIARAEQAEIPCEVIPRKEPGFEENVLRALEASQAGMAVLAGVFGVPGGGFFRPVGGTII